MSDSPSALPLQRLEEDVETASARLETDGLTKSYYGRTVVSRVSIDVGQGETVGLLGPNGAGKTTTFNMVVGMTQPDAGHVYLNNAEITALPMYRRARSGIVYLPQEASIFRKLTVEENLLAILENFPMSGSERRQRADELVKELGVEHCRSNLACTLSGGERRRVEIARALVMSPRFMLLDEPFAGIDPLAVIDLQRIIGYLTERGIGVLITDHNVRETLRITDRAYIIKDGTIFRSGTPVELTADAEVRRSFLGDNFQLD